MGAPVTDDCIEDAFAVWTAEFHETRAGCGATVLARMGPDIPSLHHRRARKSEAEGLLGAMHTPFTPKSGPSKKTGLDIAFHGTVSYRFELYMYHSQQTERSQ